MVFILISRVYYFYLIIELRWCLSNLCRIFRIVFILKYQFLINKSFLSIYVNIIQSKFHKDYNGFDGTIFWICIELVHLQSWFDYSQIILGKFSVFFLLQPSEIVQVPICRYNPFADILLLLHTYKWNNGILIKSFFLLLLTIEMEMRLMRVKRVKVR